MERKTEKSNLVHAIRNDLGIAEKCLQTSSGSTKKPYVHLSMLGRCKSDGRNPRQTEYS